MINNKFADSLESAIESIIDERDLDLDVSTSISKDGQLHICIGEFGTIGYTAIYKGGVFAVYNPDESVRVLSFECDHVETDPAGVTAYFILRSCDLIESSNLESPETMG